MPVMVGTVNAESAAPAPTSDISSSVHTSSASGGNRALLVAVSGHISDNATFTFSSPTWGTQAMTEIARETSFGGSNQRFCVLFYLLDPDSGNKTFSVTMDGEEETQGWVVQFADLTDVKPTSTIVATDTIRTSTLDTASFTKTAASGNLMVAGAVLIESNQTGNSWTEAAGTTEYADTEVPQDFFGSISTLFGREGDGSSLLIESVGPAAGRLASIYVEIAFEAVGGGVFNESLALAADAGAAAAGGLAMVPGVTLPANAGLAAAGLLAMEEAATLDAAAAVAASGGLLISGGMTLDAGAAMTASGGLLVTGSLALDVFAGIAPATTITFGPALTLGGTAALAAASAIDFGPALGLDAMAAVQSAGTLVMGEAITMSATVTAAFAEVSVGTVTPGTATLGDGGASAATGDTGPSATLGGNQ